MNMNISPVAQDLVGAIHTYMEKSSKVDYRFTLEEQIKLQQMIQMLDKHLAILIDYEIKRNKGE